MELVLVQLSLQPGMRLQARAVESSICSQSAGMLCIGCVARHVLAFSFY
jgi:hypothetical protein